MLGAPTQRWMFIQQTPVLTPSTQWCEIPAEEPAWEYHEWGLYRMLSCIEAYFSDFNSTH